MPDAIETPDAQVVGRPRTARSWLIAVVGLALFAGGLRFARLGHFPFAYDEVATFEEVDSLVNHPSGALIEQRDRLPRMIPLGFLANAVGDRAFGKTEFGSRVMMAILGTLGVVLVFVLLDGPSGLGRPTALASALLVAVWPEHLLHSQNHRFYITAWVCAGAAMLIGGRAVARRSPALMLAAALMGLAGIAAHTFQGVVLAGLALGTVAASRIERRPLPVGQLAVLGVAFCVAAAAYVGYLRPLSKGWNGGQPSERPFQAILTTLNHLGWPFAVLACLGALILIRRRPGPGAYWIALAATAFGAMGILPRFFPYSIWYGFPITLPLVVLAGAAIGRIYELLLPSAGPWAASAWVVLACSMNLPATASYYLDGSRPDFRQAALYINKNWKDGDRVVAQMTPGLLPYYLKPPARADYLEGKDPDAQVASLDALGKAPGRLWIVVTATRSGIAWKLRDWLSAHARRETTIQKKRYDYSDNLVEVYLHDPAIDR